MGQDMTLEGTEEMQCFLLMSSKVIFPLLGRKMVM